MTGWAKCLSQFFLVFFLQFFFAGDFMLAAVQQTVGGAAHGEQINS